VVFLGVACVMLEGGRGGGMEFKGVGSEEGGGGSGVGIGSCSFHSGESLAEFFPLSRAFRVHLTGFCRGAGVEVGSLFFGCTGRNVGWFGVRKGFGIDNIGSFNSDWRSACKSS